ncbi:MAG TPA: thioredoxin family protein [Saprospiraceae bacterium]|nr:thioredoxin family protein [Saprospiraceae bacterium]
MKSISKKILDEAMTYTQYRRLISELLTENKTTGTDHSEKMLRYTTLNVNRMDRLDKTIRLTEAAQTLLNKLQKPATWLVITEGWCGDAAQIIPVLAKFSEINQNITLRLLLRDENPEIMDAFLTNGTRSIPKIIFLENDAVRGSWGPRPAAAQQIVTEGKKEMSLISDEILKKSFYQKMQENLHLWYAKNKTRDTQTEVLTAALEAQ